jgi:hypothetical protein
MPFPFRTIKYSKIHDTPISTGNKILFGRLMFECLRFVVFQIRVTGFPLILFKWRIMGVYLSTPCTDMTPESGEGYGLRYIVGDIQVFSIYSVTYRLCSLTLSILGMEKKYGRCTYCMYRFSIN